MTGIPRFCPNCEENVPYGVRCECQIAATRARNRRHDALRGSASSRGYDAEWRAESRTYLLQHPYCAECARNAVRTSATLVDHIIAIRLAPHRRMDRTNWQSLCTNCHSSVKQKQERHQ
ncbi:HNH endonuclease [Sinorhizobium medicae]|uniref:HNH endonuclease n=1 Tax=Sinorhizobium medicae TaxID=110321 RepID=UPI001295DD05|nr:HNH endonuclease [Sinorhizobium medicae]MQV98360.1 HNH endonuclease [Sinorhizobium medicae]